MAASRNGCFSSLNYSILEFSKFTLSKIYLKLYFVFLHYLRKPKAGQSVKINLQISVFLPSMCFFLIKNYFPIIISNFHCAHQLFLKILIFLTFRLQYIAFYYISSYKETKIVEQNQFFYEPEANLREKCLKGGRRSKET